MSKQSFYYCMYTRHTIYVLCNYCGDEEGVEQEGFEDGEDKLNRVLNQKGWTLDESRMCPLRCPDCTKRMEAQP